MQTLACQLSSSFKEDFRIRRVIGVNRLYEYIPGIISGPVLLQGMKMDENEGPEEKPKLFGKVKLGALFLCLGGNEKKYGKPISQESNTD